MEHEVFVPVPAETLRQTLRDPARVARCVPGLQQDADASADPLSGRLKIRVGSHTITYRGALNMVEQARAFGIEGEGVEARGGGTVKITLTIRPEPTDGGTTLTFSGSSIAEGRLADLESGTRTSAAHRLLDRFAEALAAAAFEEPGAGASEAAGPSDADGDAASDDVPGSGPDTGAADASEPPVPDSADESGPSAPSVFDAPVPPPPLGADAEDEFEDLDGTDDLDDAGGAEGVDDLDGPDELSGTPVEPAAEAAHARRTMIGRSAEEVDHAPPRGRYAPAPAPDASANAATLRWIAPAAALALASAVVLGRVLRRRK